MEGYDYETTLTELKEFYPPKDDENAVADLPEAIHNLVDNNSAIMALGAMIWYLRQLNIDKALMSARNFNIYDPLRKGQALLLDGQTLAHIEVSALIRSEKELSVAFRCSSTAMGPRKGRCITYLEGALHLTVSITILVFDGLAVYGARRKAPVPYLALQPAARHQGYQRSVGPQLRVRGCFSSFLSLDAVEELMQDKEYEFRFGKMTKGLPDLERVVSRIHAGNCKIRDFLKVLEVRYYFIWSLDETYLTWCTLHTGIQENRRRRF